MDMYGNIWLSKSQFRCYNKLVVGGGTLIRFQFEHKENPFISNTVAAGDL